MGENTDETGLQAQEVQRTALREREARELPDDPERLTFRGRYDALDRKTLELIDIDNLPTTRPVRLLDFAGGILSFGSPTAHDFVDKVEATGHKTEVTVVDRFIPEGLKPNYPEVAYKPSLEKVDGEFDVVRILHLVEHIDEPTYNKIRDELIARIREGGLLISTQKLERRFKRDPERVGLIPVPSIHKIMQKRDGELVPIALLPDSAPPGPDHTQLSDEEFLDAYQKFKAEVNAGTATIHTALNEESFNKVIDLLNNNDYGIDILNNDISPLWNSDTKTDILQTLERNAQQTAERFGGKFDKIDIEKKFGQRNARLKLWLRFFKKK